MEQYSFDLLERESATYFVAKVISLVDNCKVLIKTDNLYDVIQETCFTTIEGVSLMYHQLKYNKRRPIILFFYKDNDEFSQQFVLLLKNENVAAFINENFYFLGWDIKSEYISALTDALQTQGLFKPVELLDRETSALFIIAAVDDVPMVQYCFRGNINEKNLIKNLQDALNTFKTQNDNELNLLQVAESTSHENDIGSEEYQQMMAQMLGDRDYDCLDYNQHNLLKIKIGYALFGPPSQENNSPGELPAKYEAKQEEQIENLYQTIREQSNKFAEYKDRVIISVIYNCTEPLPEEKLKRVKEYGNSYNANTDISPIPVFVLRKCFDCESPCRIFIDDTCRVYESWTNYLQKNILPQCRMVLPKNGRYDFNSEGKVVLEYHLSPACSFNMKLLQSLDKASTATGLISTGIIIAAAIPAIPVAPIVLTSGIVGTIGVGLYSMGRSFLHLVDRANHNQTVSFADSDARGAYLNIIAGSLGFVGGGANAVVSQLVSEGVNIGMGARAVVNTINIANLAASGINVGNCTYEVFNKWITDNETPSAFTIFQLSTSVLFFGNAVYNFRTVSTIVEETQAGFLQDYQDSLRSNRHRKTFNKLVKETIRRQGGDRTLGQAEVIKTVRNIQNKDEIFATLTRNNRAMNSNGVKFSAEGGQIFLNGQAVDMSQFATVSKNDVGSFLNNLPPPKQPTPAETFTITNQIKGIFKNISGENIVKLCGLFSQILCQFDEHVRECIFQALNFLLSSVDKMFLDNLKIMFPGTEFFAKLLDVIVDFIGNHARQLQNDFVLWQQTRNQLYYKDIFKYINEEILKTADKTLEFFKLALRILFVDRKLTKLASKTLHEYFKAWYTKEAADNAERNEQMANVRAYSVNRAVLKWSCDICKGYIYKVVE